MITSLVYENSSRISRNENEIILDAEIKNLDTKTDQILLNLAEKMMKWIVTRFCICFIFI